MLLRRIFRQQTAIVGLMLTALAALPLSLRVAAPDAALSLLLPLAWAGAVAGFIVAGPRRKGTRAAPLLIILGLLLLFLRVGQLIDAVLANLWQTARLLGVLVLPSPNPLVIFAEEAAWWSTLSVLGGQAISLAARAMVWLVSAIGAVPGNDMAARALCLGAAIWLVSVWAGWRIRGANDALGGLLPATAWVAVALNTNLQDRWPLWLHITAFLLLLGILNLWGLMNRWKREHTDFSDSVPEETLINAIVIIMLLLVTAYGASNFSLKDMLDRLREHQRPTSAAVAGTPGSGSARGQVRSGSPEGLQNTHLITAGPRLTRDVVMVITTGELPPMHHAEGIQAPRYYWRGATYQTYTGGGWSNPTTEIVEAAPGTALSSPQMPGYHTVHGTVDLPGASGRAAYWAGVLVEADAPLQVVWRSQPVLPTAVPTPAAVNPEADMIGAQFPEDAAPIGQYHFDSTVNEATGNELREAPPTYPSWVRERYLQLPQTVPERVRALARDLTVHGATPYDRALAIEAYLRKIPYSLEVPAPPSERDAADYFLFDLKKGYCDYYATSMVVLARAAGLPARLVTGYASGGYDPYTAQYIVRNEDAHAWAEIYFTGPGWTEFEPTAAQPLPHRELAAGGAASTNPVQPKARNWLVLPSVDTRGLWFVWWVIPSAAGLILASLLIDRLRLRAMEPDRATRHLYRRLRRSTRRIGGMPAAGQTAREYAETIAAALGDLTERSRVPQRSVEPIAMGIRELTQLYVQSLFAPAPLKKADRLRAIRAWSGIRWRIALLNAVLMLRWRPRLPSGVPSSRPDRQAG